MHQSDRTSELEQVSQSPSPPPEPPRGGEKHHLRWVWLPILLLLGVGVHYFRSKHNAVTPPARKQDRSPAAVPVVAAKARRGSIGVYITGLGAVTPIYTVSVRSRVDGQLMKVLYKEGDMVQEGDLLVEIDPRPYQVQLAQAEGQLIKDQAALENGKLDLARYQKLWSQNAI